jgi:hypothetical protein
MGFENDLLQRNAIGWNLTLGALLEQRGLSPQMTEWLQSVLPAVELIVLVLVLSALLGFSLVGVERFGHVVRTLVGLAGW